MLILYYPSEKYKRLMISNNNDDGKNLFVEVGIGHQIGTIGEYFAMTCDGVRGCSGAFVSNGKKIVGMEVAKFID